ncbi:MAG TPA: universal stress protein [Geobacter sp.]|nr:universal stress protein [Geobacter sp.]
METFKRVLVVDRMTEYSKDAVEAGISLAKKYAADLLVLRMVTNPAGTVSIAGSALNAPSTMPDETKNYASMQEQAKEELDRVINKEIGAGFPIRVILKEGKAVDEILQVVKEEKIDLMVLLAHEEGRLEHMLFGRDNDVILRKIPCSILLVKKEPEPVDW